PGANHLTPEGQKVLLDAEYPLAWGNQKVKPDAFLTGAARISRDLQTMTVAVLAFDRQSARLDKVVQFQVDTDVNALVESGESFLVRGLFDDSPAKDPDKKPDPPAKKVAAAA